MYICRVNCKLALDDLTIAKFRENQDVVDAAIILTHGSNSGQMSRVPERMVMEWVGHANSKIIRHYFRLHDEDSQHYMNNLDLLGAIAGRPSDKQQELPSTGDNSEPA